MDSRLTDTCFLCCVFCVQLHLVLPIFESYATISAANRVASNPILGFKDFERLARSIGTFKEDASQDSCQRFKSWSTNSFKFYLDLAVTDYNITEDTHRSLFLKCLDEGIRMRLENAVLSREITDFNVKQLIEKTQMFF